MYIIYLHWSSNIDQNKVITLKQCSEHPSFKKYCVLNFSKKCNKVDSYYTQVLYSTIPPFYIKSQHKIISAELLLQLIYLALSGKWKWDFEIHAEMLLVILLVH